MNGVRFLFIAPLALPACSLVLDWDSRRHSSVADDAGGIVDATMPTTLDASTDVGAVFPDGSACPAGMVSAGSYCIDATEVTNFAYAAFLAVAHPSGQPSACAENSDFTPNNWDPTAAANLPVVNVDWCDALAYCAWAGKRLCGRIGGGSADGLATAGSQWFEACSKSGARTYPYGMTYEMTACRTQASGPVAVGSTASCEGSYAGLFDMSGNVGEWEDSCAGNDPSADCVVRGGNSHSSASQATCAALETRRRDDAKDFIGFRCCGP